MFYCAWSTTLAREWHPQALTTTCHRPQVSCLLHLCNYFIPGSSPALRGFGGALKHDIKRPPSSDGQTLLWELKILHIQAGSSEVSFRSWSALGRRYCRCPSGTSRRWAQLLREGRGGCQRGWHKVPPGQLQRHGEAPSTP